MSKQKQKGTLAETAIVNYLKSFFPKVERRTLNGQYDKGDIAGIEDFVIEVKNQKTYKIPEWMSETDQERINAGESFGLLIIKPNKIGVTQVSKWWAVMPLEQVVDLIGKTKNLQSSED